MIDLYEDGDIRFPAYFQFVTVTLPPGNAQSDVYIFTKFIGNPALKDPNSNGYSGVNKVKPFRISEQYLILAEAYARTGNNGEAYNVLNTLRTARGASAVSGGDILEPSREVPPRLTQPCTCPAHTPCSTAAGATTGTYGPSPRRRLTPTPTSPTSRIQDTQETNS